MAFFLFTRDFHTCSVRPALDHIPEILYNLSRPFSDKIKIEIRIIIFKCSKLQFNINPSTSQPLIYVNALLSP